MQPARNHIERIALPRLLLGRRKTNQFSWNFQIGQLVDFHGDRAVITDRQLTAMGRQLYNIALDCAERPHRTVLGDALVEVESGTPTRNPRAFIRQARRHVLLLQAADGSRDELARQAAA